MNLMFDCVMNDENFLINIQKQISKDICIILRLCYLFHLFLRVEYEIIFYFDVNFHKSDC